MSKDNLEEKGRLVGRLPKSIFWIYEHCSKDKVQKFYQISERILIPENFLRITSCFEEDII